MGRIPEGSRYPPKKLLFGGRCFGISGPEKLKIGGVITGGQGNESDFVCFIGGVVLRLERTILKTITTGSPADVHGFLPVFWSGRRCGNSVPVPLGTGKEGRPPCERRFAVYGGNGGAGYSCANFSNAWYQDRLLGKRIPVRQF